MSVRDAIEGALIACRDLPVPRQAETLERVLAELGYLRKEEDLNGLARAITVEAEVGLPLHWAGSPVGRLQPLAYVGPWELYWGDRGWFHQDGEGKGVHGRLFCMQVAPDRLGCEWSWQGGETRDARCSVCGTEIRMHRFVPEGVSACEITDGGHLPREVAGLVDEGTVCECPKAWHGEDLPVEELYGSPVVVGQSWDGLARGVIDASMRELGEALHRDEWCDTNMPHDMRYRSPIGCPPNCPTRDHVPIVNGVLPFVDTTGRAHSPLCGLALRVYGPPTSRSLCTCSYIVTAGEGVAYDPSRDLVNPGHGG